MISVQPIVNLSQLIMIAAPYSFDKDPALNVPYHVGVHVNVIVYNLGDSKNVAVYVISVVTGPISGYRLSNVYTLSSDDGLDGIQL